MEPIDVQEGVYKAAYGPASELYAISTDGQHVIIEPTGEAPKPDALKATLLRFFAALGEQTDDSMTLPDLLDRCVPSYR